MRRFRFIVGLILLAAILQFSAKTLRGVFSMLAQLPEGTARYLPVKRITAAPKNIPASPAVWTQAAHSAKRQFGRVKQLFARPAKQENILIFEDETPQNAFMQITLEDIRPAVKNAALGEEASARLDAFLAQKRLDNAKLADETGALFGESAKKEVIKILLADERESLDNARQSKTAKEYARRQEKTDEKISKKLTALFEKYKKQFNRRLNENSPAWNEFFKRVNNFQRASD